MNNNEIKDQILESLILIEKTKDKLKQDSKEYENLKQVSINLENCLFLLECKEVNND